MQKLRNGKLFHEFRKEQACGVLRAKIYKAGSVRWNGTLTKSQAVKDHEVLTKRSGYYAVGN